MRFAGQTRQIVFKAFTDPVLYIQWLGPRELVMTLEKFEPRNGGSWRYIQKDKDGNEYAFHGFLKKGMSFSKQRYLKVYQATGQS